MARENQGLQIALIIFVILTILLGVFTFLFFRNYEEAAQKARDFDKKANDAQTTANNIAAENIVLRQKLGFDPTEKIDAIEQQVAKDMEIYAPDVEEANRVYRKVLAHQHTVIQTKNSSLAAVQDELQQLKNKVELLEGTKTPLIAEQEKRATAAEADRDSERGKFNEGLQVANQAKTDIQVKWDAAQQANTKTMGDLQTALASAQAELKQRTLDLQTVKVKIDDITKPTFELADGKVNWVNQRTGTVWINLGQADALSRQTSFAVYSADTRDVTKAGKKGSIEVTQVLGEHLAEARITEDSISDPILPGDVIHTPIWAPGERQRFALTDGLDLDGDGKSDLDTVKALITSSGGVVDASLDDVGGGQGDVTSSTDYVVLGAEPPKNAPKERIERRSNMLKKAKQLGVKVMSLQELLNRMGYKNQAPVVRYGSGANPNDFRAQPPAGGARTSTGNVSDIFQPRQPPRSTPAGAY